MKLGCLRNYHKGWVALRIYANQPACPLCMTFVLASQFHIYLLWELGVIKARSRSWTLSARWEPNGSNVTREKPRSGAVWVSDCEGNCLFQYSSLFGLLSGYNCRLRASIRRNFVKLNWATCNTAKHGVYEHRSWTLRCSEQYYSLNSTCLFYKQNSTLWTLEH